MALLGHERYCTEVVLQTGLLRELLPGTDLTVTVPTCPDWTLAELIQHIGGNLHTAETAARIGRSVHDPASQVPAAAGPAGTAPAELDAWLADAAEKFAGTLRKVGPEQAVRVWEIEANAAYWARRAVHDLVIHRADAARALGMQYTVAPDLAADAVDELLELFSDPQVAESDPGVAELRGVGKSIHLHATDAEAALLAEWLIEFGARGFSWRRAHDKATVALRGPLTDLLLVFYRRLPADSPRVQVLGDAALLDFWLERVSLR